MYFTMDAGIANHRLMRYLLDDNIEAILRETMIIHEAAPYLNTPCLFQDNLYKTTFYLAIELYLCGNNLAMTVVEQMYQYVGSFDVLISGVRGVVSIRDHLETHKYSGEPIETQKYSDERIKKLLAIGQPTMLPATAPMAQAGIGPPGASPGALPSVGGDASFGFGLARVEAVPDLKDFIPVDSAPLVPSPSTSPSPADEDILSI